MRILPQTALGKAATTIFSVGVVAFAFMQIMVASGQTGGETLTDNLLLAIPSLVAITCTIAAGGVSAISIFLRSERSILNYAVGALGFLAIIFIIGEFTTPH